jgi:hypothetical protein
MFSYIDDFYKAPELGLQTLNFVNATFIPEHQANSIDYGDRLKGYPCYETKTLNFDFKKDEISNLADPIRIVHKTFQEKTDFKILKSLTFFRKTKLDELQKSPSWEQYKQHQDSKEYDIAGLVYFNSFSLKDGTVIFDHKDSYEPTAIIGSKCNRCVFYSSQLWHAPSMEQEVEERWVQPFFITVKEETYNAYTNR